MKYNLLQKILGKANSIFIINQTYLSLYENE